MSHTREKKNGIEITDIRGENIFGKTYEVLDTKTGKEYVIDKYPKRDIGVGTARYMVGEKYGQSLKKTRTIKEALNFIKNLRGN